MTTQNDRRYRDQSRFRWKVDWQVTYTLINVRIPIR